METKQTNEVIKQVVENINFDSLYYVDFENEDIRFMFNHYASYNLKEKYFPFETPNTSLESFNSKYANKDSCCDERYEVVCNKIKEIINYSKDFNAEEKKEILKRCRESCETLSDTLLKKISDANNFYNAHSTDLEENEKSKYIQDDFTRTFSVKKIQLVIKWIDNVLYRINEDEKLQNIVNESPFKEKIEEIMIIIRQIDTKDVDRLFKTYNVVEGLKDIINDSRLKEHYSKSPDCRMLHFRDVIFKDNELKNTYDKIESIIGTIGSKIERRNFIIELLSIFDKIYPLVEEITIHYSHPSWKITDEAHKDKSNDTIYTTEYDTEKHIDTKKREK